LNETTANPVLVEIWRGERIESFHRGAVTICDANGEVRLAIGEIDAPILPRSAVKALQAIPLVESDAADAYGLTDEELAVACGSHSGEAMHLAVVRGLLAKAGIREEMLACGAHLPLGERAAQELERVGRRPLPIHNNCSGKHAGMLAVAKHLGQPLEGYERPEHPVQLGIKRVLAELCGVEFRQDSIGIDGCSVPTFAVPLRALARGMARFGTGRGLSEAQAEAARRLMRACIGRPDLVAGEGRIDTIVMRGLPGQAFVKGGAEGVHCAVLPELGLGVALKIDDGAKRGADAALAEILAALIPKAADLLGERFGGELRNWRGIAVGRIEIADGFKKALRGVAEPTSR
jgi:L-asparaginase II